MQNWIWYALAAVALIFVLRPSVPAAANLSPAQVKESMASQKNLQLIDVRTPAEHKDFKIAGSKLIPLQELEQRLGEIDKSKPVILYCRSGNRSETALKMLFGKGLKDAKHLAGGINAWKAAGLQVVK